MILLSLCQKNKKKPDEGGGAVACMPQIVEDENDEECGEDEEDALGIINGGVFRFETTPSCNRLCADGQDSPK